MLLKHLFRFSHVNLFVSVDVNLIQLYLKTVVVDVSQSFFSGIC